MTFETKVFCTADFCPGLGLENASLNLQDRRRCFFVNSVLEHLLSRTDRPLTSIFPNILFLSKEKITELSLSLLKW